MNEFERDIERRLKEVKKREDDVASREREYDKRERDQRNKEKLLSSKEETIKAREQDISNELLDKMVRISAQSEAIKKDIQDLKDKTVLKEDEFNTKERDILFALEKIQAMETDFKDKMESASILTIELSNLSARLNSKETELIAREGRIDVQESDRINILNEAHKILEEAKNMSLDAENKLCDAGEKDVLLNRTLLNIRDKERIINNKDVRIELELVEIHETKKALDSYKEKLDKDALQNEDDRLRLAREQGDVNRKLKAIEDYEKAKKEKEKTKGRVT